MASKKALDKESIFSKMIKLMKENGFKIESMDKNRPWGGFLVIDESQAKDFAQHFFPEENFEEIKLTQKLSPKILMVAPLKRLSWQYHHRRAEIWKCIKNDVNVCISDDDHEGEIISLTKGQKIKLRQGQRHRLIGKDTWGVIAEIWQHTDPNNPSDEEDIVRVQDDFGR